MVFRWDLRNLIQGSDLQYLSHKKRGQILRSRSTWIELAWISEHLIAVLEIADLVILFRNKYDNINSINLSRLLTKYNKKSVAKMLEDPQFRRMIDITHDNSFERILSILGSKGEMESFPINRYMWHTHGQNVCSTFLEEMLARQVKSNPDFCEIEFLREVCSIFLLEQEREFQYVSPELPRITLNIYLRYGQYVDYPEIAEAFILFTQTYIKQWYSHLFTGINIIPRLTWNKPSEELFEDENTTFLEVKWEGFTQIMSKADSACVYLSHSRKSHLGTAPCVISAWMDHSIPNSVMSWIELERRTDTNRFTHNASIQMILQDFFQSLQGLERKILEERWYVNRKN